MKSTWTALCLTAFISGCVKTETIVEIKEVGTLPPAYLYEREPIPSVPAGLTVEERTNYLLDAYAARKDALERCTVRAQGVESWVQMVKELYPASVVKPLDKVEPEPDDPK